VAKAKRPPQTKKKLGGPRVGENGPRQAKADAVADVQQRLQGSSAVVLTEYRGLTVHELAELRGSLREAGAEYKVYKNTLATIAARNVGLDDLTSALEGPTAFAFTQGDPVIVAKRLSDFAKKVPALVLKAGVLDGRILSSGEVGALSSLDSREVMLAKLAGLFQSPIQKLANLFAAPLNQLGSLLVQLRDKLPAEQPSADSEAPAPAAPVSDSEAPAPAAEEAESPAAAVEEARPVESEAETPTATEAQAQEPSSKGTEAAPSGESAAEPAAAEPAEADAAQQESQES